MNYLNLDSPKEPEKTKEKKETSPTAIGFLACSFVSAAFALIAGAGNMPFLFVISTTSAIMFAIVFYIDDGIPDKEEPALPRYLSYAPPKDVQDLTVKEEHDLQTYLDGISKPVKPKLELTTWKCSYCGTTNTWHASTTSIIRCDFCGARYEDDKLVRR